MGDSAILVVEDETMVLIDIEGALKEAGFEVVGKSSAVGALAAFDAEPERLKALITDIRLGAGKTGWEVARHIRRANPVIPVVYMSGDSAIHLGSEGVPNSVMISKPFYLPQITTALATLLNQQQPLTDVPAPKGQRTGP